MPNVKAHWEPGLSAIRCNHLLSTHRFCFGPGFTRSPNNNDFIQTSIWALLLARLKMIFEQRAIIATARAAPEISIGKHLLQSNFALTKVRLLLFHNVYIANY